MGDVPVPEHLQAFVKKTSTGKLREQLHQRVEDDLTLHPPQTAEVAARMDEIRYAAKEFAHLVIDQGAPGRELSTALSRIEEACFYAIASVARSQADGDG